MECVARKEIFYRSKDGSKQGKALVRCGKCLPCVLSTANEWSLRCVLEGRLHDECCCLTLTIDDEHMPEFTDETYRPMITKFLKRLRRLYPCRYFGCFEYGSQKGRPHYHVIIFGWRPADAKYFKQSDGGKVYVSAELSRLWPYGFATIGDFDDRTGAYCSKYINKIKPPVLDKKAPFSIMSLKPSIGFFGVSQTELESGYVYYKGIRRSIPRSFYQTLKRQGIEFPELDARRAKNVEERYDDDDEIYMEQLKSSVYSENMLDKLHIL